VDKAFYNLMLCVVAYDTVRQAMDGESFAMTIVDEDEFEAIKRATNQGIDAHLEACFIPDRGDSCEVLGGRAHLVFSAKSLPVLLRRLSEDGDPAGLSVLSSVLTTLGFNAAGELVGREALGLE
jgi:hypothetical protein